MTRSSQQPKEAMNMRKLVISVVVFLALAGIGFSIWWFTTTSATPADNAGTTIVSLDDLELTEEEQAWLDQETPFETGDDGVATYDEGRFERLGRGMKGLFRSIGGGGNSGKSKGGQLGMGVLFVFFALFLRFLLRALPNAANIEPIGMLVIGAVLAFLVAGVGDWLTDHSWQWDLLVLPLLGRIAAWAITFGNPKLVPAAISALGWFFMLSAPLRWVRLKRWAFFAAVPSRAWKFHAVYWVVLPITALIIFVAKV